MQLASARIITDDVDRSVAFYERLLGRAAERPAPVFAAFRTPIGTLAIGHPSTVPVPGFGRGHDGVLVELLADDPAEVDAVHVAVRDWAEVAMPLPTCRGATARCCCGTRTASS